MGEEVGGGMMRKAAGGSGRGQGKEKQSKIFPDLKTLFSPAFLFLKYKANQG